MFSLRNGTAMAIILSIAFVAVAVGARNQLPGFAGDSQNAATSIADELPADELAGSESTGADAQIGQSQNFNDSMTDPAEDYALDDDQEDDHDSDHDDDDEGFDGEDHDDDDD